MAVACSGTCFLNSVADHLPSILFRRRGTCHSRSTSDIQSRWRYHEENRLSSFRKSSSSSRCFPVWAMRRGGADGYGVSLNRPKRSETVYNQKQRHSHSESRHHLQVLVVAAAVQGQAGEGLATTAATMMVEKSSTTDGLHGKEGGEYVAQSESGWNRSLPPIKDAKRVVLVRHGQSTWNESGRIQGSSDFSILTNKGETQAETSRQMLLDATFDACFYSPLARAKRTAEIIWGERDAPVHSINELREIDLYAFEGLFKHEGKERFGEAYGMWQRDAENFVIDGHYPVRELWDRARQCWDTILLSQHRSVLVVAHNAVNQALIATAMGLGPEYFRQLLQSNCGVSVIDFKNVSDKQVSDERQLSRAPHVCLDRLNQTPSPPVAGAQSGGRQASHRLLLVCHGATDSSLNGRFAKSDEEPMNMLGKIQARKTAELLLDSRISTIICSPSARAVETAQAIAEVQEAADCLGADCVPRYVETEKLDNLRDVDMGEWKGALQRDLEDGGVWQEKLLDGNQQDVVGERIEDLWIRTQDVWDDVLRRLAEITTEELADETGDGRSSGSGSGSGGEQKTLLVVGHETVHVGMIARCLNLSSEALSLLHLDTGSVSVVDFPDGPSGRGIVRCLNYTAHLGRWAVPITVPTLGDEDF